MADPAGRQDDFEAAYLEAMRAEVDWAPLRFDGWGHYEQARPTLPEETIEVIARWPDHGYVLQYRPLLGELTQARKTPIDPFPEITVLGRIDDSDLPQLRSLGSRGDAEQLSEAASQLARTNRTIPTEPPVPTGSILPDHADVPVHYLPCEGQWLEGDRLIREDHPSAAYAIAGHWGLRLGPPVGLTPTGLLVFQPVGMQDLRITVEHPTSEPVGPLVMEARAGIYRHDGLGVWQQTATVRRVDELHMLMSSQSPHLTTETPPLVTPSDGLKATRSLSDP